MQVVGLCSLELSSTPEKQSHIKIPPCTKLYRCNAVRPVLLYWQPPSHRIVRLVTPEDVSSLHYSPVVASLHHCALRLDP